MSLVCFVLSLLTNVKRWKEVEIYDGIIKMKKGTHSQLHTVAKKVM